MNRVTSLELLEIGPVPHRGSSRPAMLAALFLAFTALTATAGQAGEEKKQRKPEIKQWIDGPVRYIALKEEVKQFKKMETDDGRALFIERFWRRRDPSPGTLANEYRELFWRRVKEANSNFVDSPREGWMTDRGKIHILYGPPTEVQTELDLAVNRTAGRGVIRWIYEGRPGERMDMSPVVVVPFERDASGEYRLSYDPDLASVFFDPLSLREGRTDKYDRFFEMMGSPLHSELSVMLDLGRMQEVPPADQVLLETVETMETYHTLPLQVKVDRYYRPEDGQPLAVINIDLRTIAQEGKPAIVARLVPTDASGETRVLGEDSFKMAEFEEYRMAQGRLALDPGEYSLTVIVADPIEAKTGLHNSSLDVPQRPRTIKLSDTVWAAAVEPVDYVALSSYDEPFHLGPFRVFPKTDAVYRQGEAINLFFEVYGAQYPLRASYQLEGLDENGQWISLGQPSVAEQSAGELAWEVPTNPRWPVGEYRVRVEVIDAEERLVTTQAGFMLEAPGAS